MIRLHTLGSLDLKGADGRTLRGILKRPKRLALLAYLASTRPGAYRSRDTLIGLFWPDVDQSRARNSLNQALYVLRKTLGSDVVVSMGNDSIGLAEGQVWCDAAALRTAIAEGRHAEALELYGGEFLPGFFLADSPDFEDWLERERAELRREAAGAARDYASRAREAGDAAAAADAAVRAAELSGDEAAVRRALVALDEMGDRARAIRLYQTHEARLARELETTPSAETRQLIEAIRARETPRPDAPAARPTPVGPPRPESGVGQTVGGGAPVATGFHGRTESGAVQAGTAVATAPHPARVRDATEEAVRVEPTARGGSAARWIGVAAALVALALVGTLLLGGESPPGLGVNAPGSAGPPRIVVMPMEGFASKGAAARMAAFLTSEVAGRLSDVEGLDVVLAGADAAAAETATALTGVAPKVAVFTVSGQVAQEEGVTRADIVLSDARTGQVIRRASLERPTEEALRFVDLAADEVVGFLRTAVGREMQERQWRASTNDPEAWELVDAASIGLRNAARAHERRSPSMAFATLGEVDSLLLGAEREARGWAQPIVLRAEAKREEAFTHLSQDPPSLSAAYAAVAEGLGHSERALELAPEDARALEIHASLLFLAGAFGDLTADSARRLDDRAAETLRRAVRLHPDRSFAWAELTMVLYGQGRFAEAYYAADRAYTADAYLERPETILTLLFTLAFETGDDTKAREWCSELNRRFPLVWMSAECRLVTLGWLDQPDPGDIDRAWRIARGTNLTPEQRQNAYLHVLAAAAIGRAGLPDSADAVLQRVRERWPEAIELIYKEAAARLQMGQTAEAERLLREYLAENPSGQQNLVPSRYFSGLREPLLD